VRYEVIKVDVTGSNIVESIAQTDITELTKNDYCRLVLTGECEDVPDIEVLRRALEGRFAELQVRDDTRYKRDVWSAMGQDTLSGVFLRRLRAMYEKAETAEERRKIELAANYGLTAMEDGADKL
jgi:hypothetical protein